LPFGPKRASNTPSTLGGANWVWRALPGQLCAANAKKIAALAVLYGRA
jgi:4-alpha-glucanotransferase